MQKQIKLNTGFSFLDQKWGGVYIGGNYFIYGSKKSGKTVLALNILENLLQAKNNCLLLTSERRKSLEIQASSIYFDITEFTENGSLKIEKIDDNYSDIEVLKEVIKNNNPTILIIDELIDKNIKLIKENYLDFIEFVEEQNITSFFIASTPIDDNSKEFVKTIAKHATGIIQLQKTLSKRNYSGTLKLKPNIGHFEGEFETTFKVEPVKGFITLSDNESAILSMFAQGVQQEFIKKEQDFEYSNIYSTDEFEFLVDSKIALSERTGERINIISYEILDNNIEASELCNALVKELNKGDKICFTDKMVYIIPENDINGRIQKLSSNLDKQVKKVVGENIDVDSVLRKTIQILNSNFKVL